MSIRLLARFLISIVALALLPVAGAAATSPVEFPLPVDAIAHKRWTDTFARPGAVDHQRKDGRDPDLEKWAKSESVAELHFRRYNSLAGR